jgi:hypothetical protein
MATTALGFRARSYHMRANYGFWVEENRKGAVETAPVTDMRKLNQINT